MTLPYTYFCYMPITKPRNDSRLRNIQQENISTVANHISEYINSKTTIERLHATSRMRRLFKTCGKNVCFVIGT